MPPREEQHRFRSKQNEQFAESLDPSDPIHNNWAVVAGFYAALHYVEAYFSALGDSCIDHGDRARKIKSDTKLRMAWPSYFFLYTLSREARYKCTVLKSNCYKVDAKPQLTNVKGFVDGILGQATKSTAAPGSSPKPTPKLTIEPPKPAPGKPK